MPDYLKKYGHAVLDNGYEVIPITPGTKAPTIDYSSKTLPKITHKRIDRWLSNGHAKDGVGIRTEHTPLLDIDCQWVPLRDEIVQKSEDVIGYAPVRIGAAPKLGLMFKSDEPFKKVQSKAFRDPNGNKAQVEFLGNGQQFVALAIHPDTKKPYRWPDKDFNPIKTAREDLATVTGDQALEVVQHFETRCIELGWERWKSKKQSTALTTRQERDPDDIMGSTQLGITIDEIRGWCERLENDEDVEYEDTDFDSTVPNYRNVIFAIWHETDGSEEGREIALEWSSKSSKHEQEEGRFAKLWGSADPEDRDDAVTFRYIIKLVLTQEEEEKRELRDGFLDSLKDCSDVDDLKILISVIAKTRFDELDLERLAHSLKSAMNRITGVTLPITAARKMLYHKPSTEELPPWVKPWVYIQHTMRFFNHVNGSELEHKAFDASYSRYLNGASAVEFALNKAQIKTYFMPMYKPDDDEEFWFNGHECINTFSERLMPEMPGRYSKKDRLAISIIEQHLERIIPNKREREITISYLAYVVQTRGRPNWAVVLQGVDGDGKSFFGEMMGAVLGANNVRMLNAQTLEDKYTAWAVGQLFTFIAELRMQGHSRYDILNKIKPFITDNAVDVHPKNVNPYTALNTTAYFATTNFKDALPLNDNDRRYFILMSAWQSGDQIRSFEAENPGYFKTLFGSLSRAGAIRQWLSEYELHQEFEPKGRAPMTRARSQMVDLSKSELQLNFEEVIRDDNHPQISADLVVSSALVKYMFEQTEDMLQGRAVRGFLSSYGYSNLDPRMRLNPGSDNKETVWVRNPDQFKHKNPTHQRFNILKYLRRRQRLITHEKDI